MREITGKILSRQFLGLPASPEGEVNLHRFQFGVLRDPEPGAGGGGTVDLAALLAASEARILAEFDKKIQGVSKDFKKEVQKLKAAEAPPPDDPPNPPPDPPAPGAPPSSDNAVVSILKRQVKALEDKTTALLDENKKTKETADKKEAEALLRSEIAKYSLLPTGANDAFDILSGRLTRGEDGNVAGPNSVDLGSFVKDFIEARPNYIPPKPAGGAGSVPNSPGSRTQLTMEDIDNLRGKTAEEKASFLKKLQVIRTGQ